MERVNFFAYCGSRALIWTQVLNNFFLVHGPPNQWRVPGPNSPPPPAPTPQWALATVDFFTGEAVFRLACVA